MLNTIIEEKKRQRTTRRSLQHALGRPGLRILGELKRASPSAGAITQFEATEQAHRLEGAAALSVLTDKNQFGGSLSDLKRVREVEERPLLRKDFLLYPRDLAVAAAAGADAVLLIVAVVGENLGALLRCAEMLELEALVEVHDEEELEKALTAGATLIGVNNRNLHDLSVDLKTAERLAPLIPRSCIAIAESGIRSPDDALRMARCGYDAILVGEALSRAENPAQLIQQLTPKPMIKICGITHPKDAIAAAEAGATHIGVIASPGHLRSIDQKTAKAIADTAHSREVETVAVFTKEEGAEISSFCKMTGIGTVQLHGGQTVYDLGDLTVITVNQSGGDHVLYDGVLPKARCGYLLAGKLTPENVAKKIEENRPLGVCVSSGIESTLGRKDPEKVRQFVQEVHHAFCSR